MKWTRAQFLVLIHCHNSLVIALKDKAILATLQFSNVSLIIALV